MTEKLVYRPREAQAALGIKGTKFWALVKAGALETRKMGGATVVPAESLRRFVDGLPAPSAGAN
ncbi:helix-turn-helix domain-containing protein [Acidocella facilis]|uniref:helix-turn-helix domain-containing protein n=1 Tax=Acidocella facilis TaxID=525 RepID=UPI001F213B24|nr:helix-turn-helix domain-containing protein [Acidocella facilis]